MDWFDEMLFHLPSPMPAADLAERICLSLRARERLKRLFRLAVYLGWGMLFLGLLLLYLFGQGFLQATQSDVATLLEQVTPAFVRAVNALLTSDLNQLAALWTGMQEMSLTAFSLILAVLTAGLSLLVLAQLAASDAQKPRPEAFLKAKGV
jgi:hypothetical protein